MMDSHIDQQEHPNKKPMAWRQWIKWGAVIFLAIDVAVTVMVWPSIKLQLFQYREQAMDDPSNTTVLMNDLEEQPSETFSASETTTITEYQNFMEGPFEGHVTLSPDASSSNFRVFAGG